jgi:hypothetical protein
MILLQAGREILGGGGAGPSLYLTFGAGVVVVAIILFIGTIIARRRAPRSAADLARYSSSMFRRAGRDVGLTPPQIQALENLVRATKVARPFLVFTNPGLLDETLKRGLYSIDSTRGIADDERENRRALLLQIKQTIERNARKSASLGSTAFLRPGQTLSVTPEGGSPFSSRVVSNMKDFLTIAAPPSAPGAESRWMRGTPLAVYLWRENDAGYSFASKVLGYDTVKGISSVLIQHSRTVRREQRRRSRRRELMRPCFFYPIRITETGEGRSVQRKAVVEQDKRGLGTLVDLSPGGCALQSTTPIEKGRLVMVEFDIDRKESLRVFGKIMHSRRAPGRPGTMNIMFTRVTRQHLNRISEYVYDYTRPAGARPPASGGRPAASGARPSGSSTPGRSDTGARP